MNDFKIAKKALAKLPVEWDGKKSVLELKKADYNWKQMEWWAFYFEYLCRNALAGSFTIPGDKIGTVTFDAKREFNWDLKAKAIKSDDHRAILNDQRAMDFSIQKFKKHGVMIALCDVEYNDKSRKFQKWHTKLKGGLSDYEIERKTRTSVSRYRKTYAKLQEILFLEINKGNVELLDIMRQGRNSNGKPRPPKYMLELENIDPFLVERLKF
jgi:hypothetical protein